MFNNFYNMWVLSKIIIEYKIMERAKIMDNILKIQNLIKQIHSFIF